MTETRTEASAEQYETWSEFRARFVAEEKAYRAKNLPETRDPEAILAKMDVLELKLRTLAGKGENQWSLEGWKVEACKPDVAIWPIHVQLHFRHTELIDYDAILDWGAEQEVIVEWLAKNGISLGEYNIEFV